MEPQGVSMPTTSTLAEVVNAQPALILMVEPTLGLGAVIEEHPCMLMLFELLVLLTLEDQLA